MFVINEAILKQLKLNFNIELNEQQRKAIIHRDGPAIVLAVPGAGKTTTMVVRIYMLIKVFGINPRSILTMTFSRASAKDMKDRYNKLFGNIEGEGVIFSTIHSFALSVIKSYERKAHEKFQIIEGTNGNETGVNKISILKRIFRDINNRYINEDELDKLCNDIGLVNNKMLKTSQFDKYEFDIDNFEEIYKKYNAFKLSNNYMDFDDMLTKALTILIENKDILSIYSNQYKYVLIDEGQDTSLIQHELVKLLVRPLNNLFLVADDDQSIYGFRGAEPKELKEFNKNYPGTKKYFIETNYRSTVNIVFAANEFIKMNDDREVKNMVAHTQRMKPIEIKTLYNDDEQISYLIDYITKKDKSDSIDIKKSTAILYRNNISALTLIDELDRKKIPFNMKDSKMFILKHWILLDILSFMAFSLNSNDLDAFEKIYYRMDAYLPKPILEYLKTKHKLSKPVLDTILEYPELIGDQLIKIYDLDNKFQRLRVLSPLEAIHFICNEFNYSSFIKKYCKEKNIPESNTDEIMFTIKTLSKATTTLVQFISRISELESIINQSTSNKNKNAIILSTIHSSKGLEFDRVIIMDLVDGKMPSGESVKKSEDELDDTLLSEEARVFYVGITRAKEELTLITLDFKNGKRVSMSRFLSRIDEIINPEKIVAESINKIKKFKKKENTFVVFPIGTKVTHGHYGLGSVMASNKSEIKINFDKHGVKSFPSSACNKYIFGARS